MNPALQRLQPYPFERLAALIAGVEPDPALPPVALSIGEPRHPPPGFVLEVLRDALPDTGRYPATRGLDEFRETVAGWLTRRFTLPPGCLDAATQILPVNGTREALFAFAQCSVAPRTDKPLVLIPNPGYQIYEGAAYLAGARPWYYDLAHTADFDRVPASVWQRTQLVYVCTPGNPTGQVIATPNLQQLLELADRHDFVIASDECYSEIFLDEQHPPAGLLAAAVEAGDTSFARCIVFHSLSKRSNLPGLRSGFVAGGRALIEQFLAYRTYHGCAMPVPVQRASIAAWRDEQHVTDNRSRYREKFALAHRHLDGVLDTEWPQAGFYLWPRTPVDDTVFARELYSTTNVSVLPGQYLGRDTGEGNPGRHRMRMALVADAEQCDVALRRLADFMQSRSSQWST